MRVTLNLASKPFVELRPLYMRLRVAMAALALLAVILVFAWRSVEKRARVAEAQMSVLQGQTEKFRQERDRNEARMREPQNAAVLARSQFLNALFVRKSFSWTAVMMDLENVLPAGVQVTSIDPQVTPEHAVLVRLRVSGERDRAVDLVKNLEKSKRFVLSRLASESLQNQGTGQAQGGFAASRAAAFQQAGLGLQASPTAVEFDIVSDYNPLPEKRLAEKEEGATKQRPAKGAPSGTGGLPKTNVRKPKAGANVGGAAKSPGPVNESVTAAQRIAAARARTQGSGGPQ